MIPEKITFQKCTLKFIRPMGTSRGVLHERETYIIGMKEGDLFGLGECAPVLGLSIDAVAGLEGKLEQVCGALSAGATPAELDLADWPAIRFGVESALLNIEHGGRQRIFDTPFTTGNSSIPNNGLIVMSEVPDMLRQVEEKVAAGFKCIKLKVGALEFDTECDLLREIRRGFPADQIELRLDANGAFMPDSALDQIERLAEFGVHSLEQPIEAGQWQAMARVCRMSGIPIALDEELIGINSPEAIKELLQTIQPSYLILKPTLLGGLAATQDWIDIAAATNTGYWITSILESNIGHNILCQWTSTLDTSMAQGLGSGRLYRWNFDSPVRLSNGCLHFVAEGHSAQIKDLSELHLRELDG